MADTVHPVHVKKNTGRSRKRQPKVERGIPRCQVAGQDGDQGQNVSPVPPEPP